MFLDISRLVAYPPVPSTFEEVIKLVPPRGKIIKHQFTLGDKPFELTIGRNDSDFLFMSFGVPDPHFDFYRVERTVEGMHAQRQVWGVWEKFMADPDNYLTWKRFEVKAPA